MTGAVLPEGQAQVLWQAQSFQADFVTGVQQRKRKGKKERRSASEREKEEQGKEKEARERKKKETRKKHFLSALEFSCFWKIVLINA